MRHFTSNQTNLFTLGTAQLGMNYGIANFTGKPKQKEAISFIHKAISEGITSLDTARSYGDAESLIGEALSTIKSSPQNVEIVTKLSPLEEFSQNSSRTNILKAIKDSIQQSLDSLQVDQLHTLLLHRWEHRYIYDGLIWNRLLELRKQGYLKFLGASVYSPHEAVEALKDKNIQHIQIPFNILDWRWKAAGFPQLALSRKDVTIHARSPLLQGLLLGHQELWKKVGINDVERWIGKLDFLEKELQRESKIDLCFSYVRSQSWISSVVIGIDCVNQLKENIKLFQKPLLSAQECEIVEKTLKGASEQLLNPSKWKHY